MLPLGPLPLLILVGFTISISCTSQPPVNSLSVSVPTIEQEATSVWRTINDIVFLESQGYEVALPTHTLVDSLVQKSKQGAFGNDDYDSIYQLLESGLYKEADYQAAKEKVLAEVPLINTIIQDIDAAKTNWDWEFKRFDIYDIVFTLYGSGGSYDPETGVVTLFTTSDGIFKRYDNPANTIIHEIAHIGMQESIVQAYNLPHGLKERVVDKFVYLLFQEQLPQYEVQQMGDAKLDNYLQDKTNIEHLGSIIRQFVQ